MGKGPEQIFQQILDGEDVGNLKMQIGQGRVCSLETAHHKIPQHTLFGAKHCKGLIKKFRQNDEIDGHILFPGRKDFLRGMLI